jgi:peptidoglycan hydrolase-like protein with peptidoglycan-binding domain
MDNIGAILDLVRNNSKDVEEIVARFGGIAGVLAAAPALLRIGKTIASHTEPKAAAERAADTLAYSAETADKVRAFQRKHHLDVDGIVGNKTWQAVEDLLHTEGEEGT